MEQTIWQQEQAHLKQMSELLKKQVEALEIQLKRQKGDIVEERTQASSEFNDVSGENAIQFSQMLQTMQLREREYLNASEQLAKTKILYKSPYFGRISIENEQGEKEHLYIGLSTFREPETDDVLIFDWRAPISSLFYENKVGLSRYQIPDGEYIDVVIEGRRQYKVKYDELIQLFDADVYVGDEVLQGLLADTAKEKMKSIVATIQSDQNAVIRSSNQDNLIVLGPPGSGKTSVAMQRIAFLLYEYRKTMNARSILLISPSDLFNDYISNVLPELGEENVQHTTYYRLLRDLKLSRYDCETNYENIERLQIADEVAREHYAFKGSHLYVKQLLNYMESIKKAGMPFYNLKMGDDVFASAKKISQLFYEKFGGLDVDFRLKKIRTLLQTKLQERKNKEQRKRIKELRAVNAYIGSDKELEQQAYQDVQKKYGKLEVTIEQLGFVNLNKMYLQSLTFRNDNLFTQSIQATTAEKLKQHKLLYEDLAPIMYLQAVIKGLYTDKTIKHIVIDEIQDYSYLQLLTIKAMHPKAHYTLLGDKNQMVHPQMKDSLAGPLSKHFKVIELNKSYRSTNEITDFMSAILHNTTTLSLGVSGDKPQLIETKALLETIQQLVVAHYEQDDSFVILCKNRAASERLYNDLKSLIPTLQLVTEEQKVYMKGILIMPGYMAKGFEFTTVVLADASAHVYHEEMDAYLLYTIASRATRKLFLLSDGTLPKALAHISEQYYLKKVTN
ncbi:DNA helicase [Lysinibacillus sp. 2017]|uniref:RNA polymerase recycling motor HelD n=1 Tax=unclassified Lysinibacillus TaxID=2636778 RepID=UPI000D529BBD|nr:MULTISPECIES: RNA polymerase recycling motor HelD [unclassified Lysinibacillus]AWE06209.1 DNA helicase [Lysinibacillus sp. 2017]TGN30587.1 DNA helicase [Lysinibacillus sp. S2017]